MNQEKNIEEYINSVREIISRKDSPILACVHSYGCQLNFSDGEKLKGMLAKMGFGLTDKPEDAGLVIFNTCAVRENAEDRVFGNLGFLKHYKEKNPEMIIGLCGCMTGLDHVVEKINNSYKFVDIVFGTSALDKFPKLLFDKLSGKKHAFDTNEYNMPVEGLEQKRDSTFKASVPIMFGCNNFCTYCIVPYVRGRERSRKPENIIQEVKELVASGYKEIMLLGQNVNSYGKTLENPVTFAQLLTMLEEVEGLKRIRFMTSHPKDLSDELIEVMAKSKKICHHLHLPLQSGSSRVLKEMNRRYDKEKYLNLVEKIRTAIPDISLTTDIIVGFPGETEEDFQETLDVVKKAGYDTAFTFIYSKRTGTPAAAKEDQVPADVTKERFNRLLALVQEQGRIRSSRFAGTVQEVLVEEESKEKGIFTGRTQYNLLVHFPADESLLGTYVNVKLEECKGFYYLGSLAD